MTFGAAKYGELNWLKGGLASLRLIGASLRHTFAHLFGERIDPESGLPHLWHAGASTLMAIEIEEREGEAYLPRAPDAVANAIGRLNAARRD